MEKSSLYLLSRAGLSQVTFVNDESRECPTRTISVEGVESCNSSRVFSCCIRRGGWKLNFSNLFESGSRVSA